MRTGGRQNEADKRGGNTVTSSTVDHEVPDELREHVSAGQDVRQQEAAHHNACGQQ